MMPLRAVSWPDDDRQTEASRSERAGRGKMLSLTRCHRWPLVLIGRSLFFLTTRASALMPPVRLMAGMPIITTYAV